MPDTHHTQPPLDHGYARFLTTTAPATPDTGPGDHDQDDGVEHR
ncbi:hypothetical protein ACF08M_41005 [Streptomyces sp. NPDC015032]